MGIPSYNRPDVAGCVNSEHLARLFDDAFGEWRVGPRNPDERRDTPRVPIAERPGHSARPIFVVGYAFNGYEVDLNVQAPIVDISADGMGIRLSRLVPPGAIMCFAFENASSGLSYDVARVMRCEWRHNSCHIGLAFVESARSLDQYADPDDSPTNHPPPEKRNAFNALLTTVAHIAASGREALLRASERLSLHPPKIQPAVPAGLTQRWRRFIQPSGRCRLAFQRAFNSVRTARREIAQILCGRQATFVVQVMPFRYRASLMAGGRRVASQSGLLNNRVSNILSSSAAPTLVHIQGGGFNGWAVLRPGRVVDCGLNLCVEVNQAIGKRGKVVAYSRVADAVALATPSMQSCRA